MPTNDDPSAALSESTALRELQQEVERWRSRAELAERILEVSPGHTFVFDAAERRTIYSSSALARMLGYAPEEIVRMGPDFQLAVVHPDDLPRAAQVEAELAAGEDGSVVLFEHRLRHRSGEWRWVEARCVVFSRAPDRSLQRYEGVVRDITERKRKEEEVREQEEALRRANVELEQRIGERTAQLRRKSALLEGVIENMPAVFYVQDAEGRFLLVNRRCAELMHLDRAQVIGQLDVDLLTPEVAELRREDHGRIRAEGVGRETEVPFPQEDGIHTYLAMAFPIHDEQGNVFAVGEISTDITERKRVEQEREALQTRMIEAQRAAIRELSTPLLPLAEGVVVMPLVGAVDSARAQQIMETLLSGVVDQQARLAILDVTGLKVVDTQVADALLRAARAARLLGAEVMLTGVQPQIAQVLVQLGVDMKGLTTKSTLQAGVAAALGPAPRGAQRGDHRQL